MMGCFIICGGVIIMLKESGYIYIQLCRRSEGQIYKYTVTRGIFVGTDGQTTRSLF